MYYVGLFYAYTLQEKADAFGVEGVDAVLLSTTRQSALAFKV